MFRLLGDIPFVLLSLIVYLAWSVSLVGWFGWGVYMCIHNDDWGQVDYGGKVPVVPDCFFFPLEILCCKALMMMMVMMTMTTMIILILGI